MDFPDRFGLIGAAPAFLKAVDFIRRIANCDASTLILGETGTGKELAARAIHYLGARRGYPFIPVNCGAIPDSLLENELFGHARGAFTDAREGRGGVIADAEGGSLFLDELEALTARGQIVLLRFLQDRVYRPLGGRRMVSANVRIIAASNENLGELVERGQFRRDLYFRLNVMEVEMPPLRNRPGDVRDLAEHFLRKFSCQYETAARTLSADSWRRLASHSWPGNVRELENLLHREFLLAEDGVIRISRDLVADQRQTELNAAGQEMIVTDVDFSRAKARVIEDFERSFLSRALEACEGNVTLAARRCGKDRRSFGKLMKKHGITRQDCCR